jgi:hypothetical protein
MLDDVQRLLFAPDTTTSAGCPHVTAAFDPLDPEVAANPYPHIADLRRDTPVFEMPQYGMWCVTRHADIREVLRDPVLFSNAPYANVTPIPEAVKARVGEDYVPPITSDQILRRTPRAIPGCARCSSPRLRPEQSRVTSRLSATSSTNSSTRSSMPARRTSSRALPRHFRSP